MVRTNRTPEVLEARLVKINQALKALNDPQSSAARELEEEREQLEGYFGPNKVWIPGLIEKAQLEIRRAEYGKVHEITEAARAKLETKTDEELASDEAALHGKTQALMAERAETETRIRKEQRQIQLKVDAILAERLRRVRKYAGEPGSSTQAIGG